MVNFIGKSAEVDPAQRDDLRAFGSDLACAVILAKLSGQPIPRVRVTGTGSTGESGKRRATIVAKALAKELDRGLGQYDEALRVPLANVPVLIRSEIDTASPSGHRVEITLDDRSAPGSVPVPASARADLRAADPVQVSDEFLGSGAVPVAGNGDGPERVARPERFHGQHQETGVYEFTSADIAAVSPLRNGDGKVVGVSFLTEEEHLDSVRRWLAGDHGETMLFEHGVRLADLDALKPGESVQGRAVDLSFLSTRSPWVDEPAGTFFVSTHGSAQFVDMPVLQQNQPERVLNVDGQTLARILQENTEFQRYVAGGGTSVTLLVCHTSRIGGHGGVAYDFQRRLAATDSAAMVHAPTHVLTLYNLNEDIGDFRDVAAELGIRDRTLSLISDGGHWETIGGVERQGDARLVQELISALGMRWGYAEREQPVEPTAKISAADRAETLKLAQNLVNRLEALLEEPGTSPGLHLAEIASAVDAHERPELIWPVLLTRVAMSSRVLRDVG